MDKIEIELQQSVAQYGSCLTARPLKLVMGSFSRGLDHSPNPYTPTHRENIL
jgi:hypothetical protein